MISFSDGNDKMYVTLFHVEDETDADLIMPGN